MSQATSTREVEVRGLWKVFGRDPRGIMESEWRDKSRTEVQTETGHVIALRDVSFHVAKGETFVIMGLSGSGKSTLVRCLLRLIEPSKGQILVDGEDILQYSSSQLIRFRREKAGMIFQRFALMPHRNIVDNAAFGLELQGVGKRVRMARAREVLQLVGLAGWESNMPHELSGGMQQRVGLARALAADPEILLMDEPFSALDPLIRREMQDGLCSLQKQLKKTIIFITHDLDEALRLGDRIAVMRDGCIVQVGTPNEIVISPRDEYVSEFTKNVRKAAMVPVRSIMIPPSAAANSFLLEDQPIVLSPDATVEAVLNMVVDYDWRFDRLPVVDDEGRLVGEVRRATVREFSLEAAPGLAATAR